MFNFGGAFTAVATVIGQVAVDETKLLAGTAVPLPATLIVGSTGGKPIYLTGDLTTTKPATSGVQVPTGFDLGVIFTDVIEIDGILKIDEAELASGAPVPVPAAITVGTIKGTPVYLAATLTTTKPPGLTV